ncbi:MAG: ASCH domain-containing protein, partial [Gammaproteobacteria bacterium]|nr:ASCH domain-containing protein [Gammaproteobacteria bacterium]
DFELNEVPRREAGDYWIILWENFKPACVLEIVNVELRPFKDVDAAFAAREGEGDGSLEYWKQCHEEYFKLQLGDWGKPWSEDLPVVLESFELVAVNEDATP